MIELSMDGDHAAVGVAGDTLNTAIYLKRTAPAIQVDYVTRLGQEPFSRKIRDFIAAQRVVVDAIEYDVNGTPGLYAITTDAGGERSFTYWRNQSAARKMFQTTQGPNFGALKGYDVLYLSGISLAILPQETRETLLEWLAGYQSRGGRVVYDSNHRPKLWPDAETAQKVNAEMWAIADIALPSIDDEAVLSGESPDEIAARFLRLGKTGALKRGPSGPLCLATGAVGQYRQAARVVDTTAAGDSFNGGYLGALFQGANQAGALRVGHDLAARVVGYKGAIVPT
jgi:2-dehydro-3-deoxygluconokinase